MKRKSFAAACCWICWILATMAQNAGTPSRAIPSNLPEKNPYSSTADLTIGQKL